MHVSKLLLAGLLAIPLLADMPYRESPAFDPGTPQRVGKNAVTVLPSRSNVHAWCVISDGRNVDLANVQFGTGASSSATVGGIVLAGGASICDPVGGGAVYSGAVTVAAQTTAGTISGFSPGPVVYTFSY